jgi:hypothetical protein
MTTGAAFETNIGAQTGHSPLVPAAGVWFTQAKDVVQLQVREHGLTDDRLRVDQMMNRKDYTV